MGASALALAALLLASGPALAQDADSPDTLGPDTLVPDTGPETPQGTTFNIAVINETTQNVAIRLRPKGGAWTSYTVPAGTKPIYSCQGCGGQFEVSVSTAGTAVTYNLNSGTLYAIRVNPQRDIFDIYTVN
jgi:hypothetical protein